MNGIVLISSTVSLNKASSSEVGIILRPLFGLETLLIWDQDVTTTLLINQNPLYMPQAIHIIPEYILKSNHRLSPQ